MVWACAVQTRRFAFCGELNVRYANPVRPSQIVLATAELVNNRRGRIFEAKGELRDESGLVLASATGKYLPLKAGDTEEMARDLVGNLAAVLGPG